MTKTAPFEKRRPTDHYFENCFVAPERMKAYEAFRAEHFGIGASSTSLAERLNKKIGVTLRPAVSTDSAITNGLIYTDPVPMRAHFIASDTNLVLLRRTALGTSVKDHAMYLFCIKAHLDKFRLTKDEFGFTQVQPTPEYYAALESRSYTEGYQDPEWRQTSPHNNAVSLQTTHNVGPMNSLKFFDPVPAIENCRESAHCQGGNSCFMGRLLSSLVDKGSFNYLYPYTQEEANLAAQGTGIPYGTIWGEGVEIAAQYTSLAALVRAEGDEGVVIKVNNNAHMGAPWGVRLNKSEAAAERARSMAHYMGSASKWIEDPSREYLELVTKKRTLALITAKTKQEVMNVKKYAEGGARLIMVIPAQLKFLLQRVVQPFEAAKVTLVDAVLHYPDKLHLLKTAQKVSLSKGGKNLIVQALDAQLDKSPIGFATSGDDSLFAVLHVDDETAHDPIVKCSVGQLDMSSYDLHLDATQDKKMWDMLTAKLANVDAGLAELTRTIREHNNILLKGMGVIQLSGKGTSGLPLQSTANDTIMIGLLERIKAAILKMGTRTVNGRLVCSISLPAINRICLEETRRVGQVLKAVWDSVPVIKPKPAGLSILERKQMKISSEPRFWGDVEMGEDRHMNVRVSNVPGHSTAAGDEDAYTTMRRSLMIAADEQERESLLMYLMGSEGLTFKFLGLNFTVTQMAQMPCIFDLTPPINLNNQLQFQWKLFTGEWSIDQFKEDVSAYLDTILPLNDLDYPIISEFETLRCMEWLIERAEVNSRYQGTVAPAKMEEGSNCPTKFRQMRIEVRCLLINFYQRNGMYRINGVNNGTQPVVLNALADFTRLAPNLCYSARGFQQSDAKCLKESIVRAVGQCLGIGNPYAVPSLKEHTLKFYFDVGKWVLEAAIELLQQNDQSIEFEQDAYHDELGLDGVNTLIELIRWITDPRFITLPVEGMRRFSCPKAANERVVDPSSCFFKTRKLGPFGLVFHPQQREHEPYDPIGHVIKHRNGEFEDWEYWHVRAPTVADLRSASPEWWQSLAAKTKELRKTHEMRSGEPEYDYSYILPTNLANRAAIASDSRIMSKQMVNKFTEENFLTWEKPKAAEMPIDKLDTEHLMMSAEMDIEGGEKDAMETYETFEDMTKMVIEGGGVFANTAEELKRLREVTLRSWARPPANVPVRKTANSDLANLLAQAKGVPGGNKSTQKTKARKARQRAKLRGQVEAADLERDDVPEDEEEYQ